MFQHIVLLVLVTYPVLCLLPFNLIRFRWGFVHGSAPMPPEIEAKAEVADRTALFLIHLLLCVLVAVSMRGASISLDEVGLSLANWKRALGMGLMFSLVFVGLGELFLSKVPPADSHKEAESRGPVAVWCGIILSVSFSREIWRAFCIVALIHYGFPARLSILLTALFSAAVLLKIGIANTLGAAAAYGASGRNTHDNFLGAAAKIGLSLRDIPPCATFFAPVSVAADGRFVWSAARKRPGDFADLRAEMNVVLAVSNCPHPLDPAAPSAQGGITLIRHRVPKPAHDDPCRTTSPEAVRAFTFTDRLFA